MATKVSLENNILKVDDGVKIKYWVAAWCYMEFDSTGIIIHNGGKYVYDAVRISFTDFQDGAGTPIATEALIATYLSDKIG